MPVPPNVDPLDKINFITSYFLQGCEPPFWLFCQFAKPAAGKLWLLLFGFDWKDILKDWLRPGTRRRRSPGRHGRKSRRGRFDLDPNSYVGSRARQSLHEYPGLDMPGARAVFRIHDAVEWVNITSAVLDGVSDIGYTGLLGILSAHPENCPNMAYFTSDDNTPQPLVGVAPSTVPFSLGFKTNGQHFEGPDPFLVTTFVGEWTIAVTARIEAVSAAGFDGFRLIIRSATRGIIGESYEASIGPGEFITLTVSADCLPGEFVSMCRVVEHGSVVLDHVEALGFSGGLL